MKSRIVRVSVSVLHTAANYFPRQIEITNADKQNEYVVAPVRKSHHNFAQ